ncbi:MAG: hypothetical protein FJY65_00710, partial [Calditrichaeota bacterium]|nr:hypothetical protein [Calditrichota bacterium]
MNYDAIKRNVQNAYNSYVNNRMDPFEHLFIVGDRMQYERGTPAAQWIIQCPAGETIWGGPQHADYYYALLEGDNNDIHPDVSFSRMPAGSEGVLNLMFGRTLAYEAAPRMQNPEWYGRGAVYSAHWGNDAQGAWHITIHTNVRWGVEVLKKLGFNTVNFFEVYDYDREGNQVGNFMRERYNEGFNIGIGRAEIYYWQSSFQGVNNNTVFPIDICYSGHGEWALECIFRTGDANNMKGPVARTCGWGWPSTAPMSYVWLAMVNGHLQRDWPLGWARMFSLNHIETIFPNFQAGGVNQRPLYQHIKTDTDMWGDPGVQPWIGTPRLASAPFPRQIAPGTKLLETRVTVPNSPTPVQGAQVTLYAPGPMPAQNQGLQYAAYNRMWMKTTKTDADGYARFVLTNRDTLHLNTQIFLTVSGRDIRPLFDTATVAVPPVSITVGSHSFEQQSGNDDDALNPGEFFRISLMARNNGNQQTVENLEANIRSLSPYIEIIDNNNIWFGDVAAGRTVEGSNGVDFGIAAICPDAASRPSTKPALEIDFFSGDVHWISAVPLNITAPNWELARIVGGSEIPDSLFDMNLEFKNIGACTAPPASIVLRSLGMGATVIGEGSSLPRIDPNAVQRIERPFSVAGNRVVVPGSITKLLAVISTREGFVDSAEFEVKIRRPRANAPQGPDAGGYICFDNTDTLWDIAPQYEWVEICPQVQDRNFTGARIPFEGRSAFDIGEARVIALGCSTQFYGKLYDSITVATNGFICMGSQRMITNFQNWPMDHAIGGGVGMLAPFWDDLRLGDGSGVFYHHDTLENRVIVQWHRMRLGANQNAPEVTFEVILLDRRWWMTNETGNQNIIFQYRQIAIGENIRGGDQPWDDDIPYASVGISSPDGRTGLNYYFNNVYNVSSAPLSNRRALLFTTSPRFRAGALYGWVIDFGTGLPVEGATIYTKHGFIAFTDQDGYWRIAESLAEIPFDITCHKQGYNDSTYTDLIVDEQDSLNINFDLLHPEFIPSSFQLNEWLDPGLESQIPFYIFNGGNGPLYWSAEKRLLGDANAAPWELRRSYWVGDTLDDDRLEGVVFDGEYFYLSGAAGNNPNLIYVVDRDGNRVRDFVQPGESVYGMKDLEWDGELLWGSGEQRVFGFDRDGNVAAEFNGPTNPNQAIAYDPDNGILWICALTNNISAYDRQGNGLNRTLNRRGLRVYGL